VDIIITLSTVSFVFCSQRFNQQCFFLWLDHIGWLLCRPVSKTGSDTLYLWQVIIVTCRFGAASNSCQ
jgi:hypothetical protein